jgi:hypothetical protein
MRKIQTMDIEDGMVLAEEVRDNQGQVLLNTGDKLRKTYISKLQAWGVKEVVVEGKETAQGNESPAAQQQADNALPPEMEERIMARITRRFANVIDDPLMRSLMAIAAKHVLARAAKKYAGR